MLHKKLLLISLFAALSLPLQATDEPAPIGSPVRIQDERTSSLLENLYLKINAVRNEEYVSLATLARSEKDSYSTGQRSARIILLTLSKARENGHHVKNVGIIWIGRFYPFYTNDVGEIHIFEFLNPHFLADHENFVTVDAPDFVRQVGEHGKASLIGYIPHNAPTEEKKLLLNLTEEEWLTVSDLFVTAG